MLFGPQKYDDNTVASRARLRPRRAAARPSWHGRRPNRRLSARRAAADVECDAEGHRRPGRAGLVPRQHSLLVSRDDRARPRVRDSESDDRPAVTPLRQWPSRRGALARSGHRCRRQQAALPDRDVRERRSRRAADSRAPWEARIHLRPRRLHVRDGGYAAGPHALRALAGRALGRVRVGKQPLGAQGRSDRLHPAHHGRRRRLRLRRRIAIAHAGAAKAAERPAGDVVSGFEEARRAANRRARRREVRALQLHELASDVLPLSVCAAR